ncbi:MAG TPA: Ltp family lipoprotein [Microbacterium sp.]|nr:Ltp family lipoprotein [Microbacterium sp.]
MSDPTAPGSSPAGWYPAGVAGQLRYWDGAAWTEHVHNIDAAAAAATPVTTAPATVDPQAVAPETSAKRPWYKRPPIIIPVAVLGGVLVLGGVIGAINGGDDDADAKPLTSQTEVAEQVAEEEPAVEVAVPETTGMTAKEAQAALENAGLEVEYSAAEGVVLDRDNWTVLSTSPAAGATAKTGDTVVVNVEKILSEAEKAAAAEEEKRKAAEAALAAMTLGQRNAVGSAQSYLQYSGFSRSGLHQQLTSEYGEGFPAEDAEFALVYLEQNGLVDWNAEAVESAKSYLDYSNFSRDGLFEQLTSEYGEGFTPDQANHALAAVGY